MDDFFGKYLLSYRDKKSASYFDQTRKKCMVIIESRDSFWLPLVIKNAIDKCPDFNLYVFSTEDIIEKLKISIQGDFKVGYLSNPKEFRQIKNYNLLLTSELFWHNFHEDHVIIFQLDTLFLREPKVEEYNHDFLGALCGGNLSQYVTEKTFIINGGLSYRTRSAMIRACREMKDNIKYNRETAEDVLFTHLLRNGNYRFPSTDHCFNFSIETVGNVSTCVGVHGTDKYFLERETKQALQPILHSIFLK